MRQFHETTSLCVILSKTILALTKLPHLAYKLTRLFVRYMHVGDEEVALRI
jgi:hypothetical protein